MVEARKENETRKRRRAFVDPAKLEYEKRKTFYP
jgi:hypothetical protein